MLKKLKKKSLINCFYCFFKDERNTTTTKHVASEPGGEALAQLQRNIAVEAVNGHQQRILAAVDRATGCSRLTDRQGAAGQQQHPDELADHTIRH